VIKKTTILMVYFLKFQSFLMRINNVPINGPNDAPIYRIAFKWFSDRHDIKLLCFTSR